MTTQPLKWRRALCVLALAAAATLGQPARAQMDDFTQAVLGYELSLPKVEAYTLALQDLVAWAKKHPKDLAVLRGKSGGATTTLEAAIARLERTPAIKTVLDKHGLSGRDFALAPMALMTSHTAVMAAQHGAAIPADRINVANVALVKTNAPRIEQLMPDITAALRTLRGEK
jgi:pimeloyl-ACP methyl ester carboxylesterase